MTHRPWLAVDTATDSAAVAVFGSEVLAERIWVARRRHTVTVAPAVAEALAETGLGVADLGGIAVAIGPGSYTGLRVGLALAKGLALGAGLDIVGVPTLDVLAAGLWPLLERGDRLWAVLRAGRGRVVAAAYRDGDWPSPESLSVRTIGDLAAAVSPGDWVAGELDLAARHELARTGARVAEPASCVRRPGYLAELGRLRASDRDRPAPADLAPVYPR